MLEKVLELLVALALTSQATALHFLGRDRKAPPTELPEGSEKGIHKPFVVTRERC